MYTFIAFVDLKNYCENWLYSQFWVPVRKKEIGRWELQKCSNHYFICNLKEWLKTKESFGFNNFMNKLMNTNSLT